MSSGTHAYFRLVVKRVTDMVYAHRKPAQTVYLLDLDFVKIKLFDKVVPKTCHNFAELCTHNQGFGFAGSSFYQAVRGFGVYGGDVVERSQSLQPHDTTTQGLVWNGTVDSWKKPQYLQMPRPELGKCGRSVYGSPMKEMVYEDESYFEDENFETPHDTPGILTMANSGPNTNTSRFVILTAPAPYLDGKNVAFGQVVEGMDTIHEIDERVGSQCGLPNNIVEIAQCGILSSADEPYPRKTPLWHLNRKVKADKLAFTKERLYVDA